jgi:hypothetical protein
MELPAYEQAQAEWDAAGPPAPLTTGDASWLIALPILLVMLLALIQDMRT